MSVFGTSIRGINAELRHGVGEIARGFLFSEPIELAVVEFYLDSTEVEFGPEAGGGLYVKATRQKYPARASAMAMTTVRFDLTNRLETVELVPW